MLIILSPAKTLDFETPSPVSKTTAPKLLKDSSELASQLKQLSPRQIGELMGISEKLSELNHARFQDWESPHPRDGSKAAAFAFQGDVYRGLQADQWTAKQIEYAQNHLCMLSGLYGVLRPLDRILPYRLEMGTRLVNSRGKSLYEFWGSKIGKILRDQIATSGSRQLLNLASNEYFKSVDMSEIGVPVIAPAFKEFKNGQYKMITLFAKVARGTMASWVIRNHVKTLKKLTQFNEDGYRYSPEHSTAEVPVFVRGGDGA